MAGYPPYNQTTVYTNASPYPIYPPPTQQTTFVTTYQPSPSQPRPCQWCQYKANKKAGKHHQPNYVTYATVQQPSPVPPVVVVGSSSHHHHHQHRNHNLAAAALIVASDRPLLTAGLIGAYRRNR